MNKRQVLESVETGLERMLVKSDIGGEKDLAPGLRIAVVYLRSRIDQCIDADALEVVDRALPAPEQPAEGAQEPQEMREAATNVFEPVPQSPKKRHRE